MNEDVKAQIHACAAASREERIGFGEVVARLTAVGVERYFVDFVRGDITYYMADGAYEVLPAHTASATPALAFSADGIAAAVRGAQAGTLLYKAFCEKALAAGCTGYTASMTGRRVVYYGRTGDSHIEYFPGSRS